MFCIYCGAEISEDSAYCPACGKPVSEDRQAENAPRGQRTPSTDRSAGERAEQRTPGSRTRRPRQASPADGRSVPPSGKQQARRGGAPRHSRKKQKRKLRFLLLLSLLLVLAAGTGLWFILNRDKEAAAGADQGSPTAETSYSVSDELMAAVGENTSVTELSRDDSTATLRIVAPDLRSLMATLPADDAEALTSELTAKLREREYTSIEKTVTVPVVEVDGQRRIEYTEEYLDAVYGGLLSLMDSILEGREP